MRRTRHTARTHARNDDRRRRAPDALGGAARHRVDALLAHFSADFTMIMTDGRAVDRDGLRALFATLGGAKPGLRITLSDVRVLAADASHAVVAYVEAQHAASGELPARRSTAVFARDAAGAVRWTHLQETFCAA
nr:nuclear transport factor 2 family protein [Burkholderia multivorans]